MPKPVRLSARGNLEGGGTDFAGCIPNGEWYFLWFLFAYRGGWLDEARQTIDCVQNGTGQYGIPAGFNMMCSKGGKTATAGKMAAPVRGLVAAQPTLRCA